MKHFFLMLALLPLISGGQTYTYNKVTSSIEGSSNFSNDRKWSENKTGTIVFDRNEVTIGRNKFEIKDQASDNVYLVKAGFIKLLFSHDRLSIVQVTKFNTSYFYHIKNDDVLASQSHKE
jgi:hypothetical protein